MRIISQRKDTSVEFEKVVIRNFDNMIWAESNDDIVALGIYDKPGRADEVFEEMHKAYNHLHSVQFFDRYTGFKPSSVYYMPEE